MIATIIICALTCVAMIIFILVKPTIKIKKVKLDTYWIISLTGAVILLAGGLCDYKYVWEALIADNGVNPIKILLLFISMMILSVYLDELGFFAYLASVALKHANKSQYKLFLYIYIAVSVLTVFTSNDIIILSFTPFICYFAKHAKISPMPYLASEFVAANTWSMALIIGNPTNIYLCSTYGIDFIEYIKTMILPTVVGGTVAFIALFIMFRKKLKEPIVIDGTIRTIENKPGLIIGIIFLSVCTVLLAVSSYIGLEMYFASVCCVVGLLISALILSLIRRRKPIEIGKCFKRAPWQLIPFVISMFVIVTAFDSSGITDKISDLLGSGEQTVFVYGLSSLLASNVINNIPMSVLYCSVIKSVPAEFMKSAVYSTVVGSNIGAFLTPIGALAGIMWSSILKEHGLKFGYVDFLKMGIFIALPTVIATLGVLYSVIRFII